MKKTTISLCIFYWAHCSFDLWIVNIISSMLIAHCSMTTLTHSFHRIHSTAVQPPAHSVSEINDLHYSILCHIIIFEHGLFRPFRSSTAKIPFLNHVWCMLCLTCFYSEFGEEKKIIWDQSNNKTRNAQYNL